MSEAEDCTNLNATAEESPLSAASDGLLPMNASQKAAANIVPLLARVLLFLAFVPPGWHHLMDIAVFDPDSTARLVALGAIEPGTNTGRCLHELTLAFETYGMPRPELAAWGVGVFELVGGALLVVGLFSRLWAGGLLAWGIIRFWLTAAPALQGTWFFGTPEAELNLAFAQLGLIVLAFGVVLTGPGALSMDHYLFRSGKKAKGSKPAADE
ncbi:MAG: DoxX family protein [Phycisphaerales bacterium]|nr:DoxX family protein [Phycisphaerales bacterium]